MAITAEDVMSWLEYHWAEIAPQMYAAYKKHGRGALAMDLRALDTLDENAKVDTGFIMEKNLLKPEMQLTEDNKALLREYDPETTILTMAKFPGNRLLVGTIGGHDRAHSPKRLYEKKSQLIPYIVPDDLRNSVN